MRRAQPIEDAIWGAVAASLSDRERLTTAISDWKAKQGIDSERQAQRAQRLRRRLDALRAERLRTFSDAPQVGLTDDEVEQILRGLAAEIAQAESQLAQIDASAVNAPSDTNLDHLITTAQERLGSVDVDYRAAVLGLLDVQVTPTHDGYQLEASIPLQHANNSEQAGYIATLDPQHS